MGGVGCQLLIMQTFPRSRCIFTPGVRILWRYAGLYKHAVQSSNMSQTDFKAKKILSKRLSEVSKPSKFLQVLIHSNPMLSSLAE